MPHRALALVFLFYANFVDGASACFFFFFYFYFNFLFGASESEDQGINLVWPYGCVFTIGESLLIYLRQ